MIKNVLPNLVDDVTEKKFDDILGYFTDAKDNIKNSIFEAQTLRKETPNSKGGLVTGKSFKFKKAHNVDGLITEGAKVDEDGNIKTKSERRKRWHTIM